MRVLRLLLSLLPLVAPACDENSCGRLNSADHGVVDTYCSTSMSGGSGCLYCNNEGGGGTCTQRGDAIYGCCLTCNQGCPSPPPPFPPSPPLPLSSSAARRLLVAVRCAGASRRYLTMHGHLRYVTCFAALGGTAATTEMLTSFTESRGRSGTCSPGAACDGDTRCDHGVSLSKGRLVSDAAPQSAALCAPVNGHLVGTCSALGFGGLLMAVISILVVACVWGVEALARARDARKPDDGRNRCAQGRASAASPRQKTSLPQLGRATTQLRPVVMLCLMSAASAVPLATNVNISPPPSPPPPSPPPMRPGAIFGDKTSLVSALNEWCANQTDAHAKHGQVSTWDVSAVTDMSRLIHGYDHRYREFQSSLYMCHTRFDEDINAWDVGQVTDMQVRRPLTSG